MKFAKNLLLAIVFATMVILPSTVQAKVIHLLPKPQVITETGETFALGRDVTIAYEGGAEKCALLEEFFTGNNCNIVTSGGVPVTVTIVESITNAYDYTLEGFENEAYTLTITANAINITAVKPIGIIRAAQTLTQLAEGYDGIAALETVNITDWAAFKLRGFMHDVGRSFISVDEIKTHIELLSRFKVNCFHWHFTENQAWRFEVKAYPELTSTESMTRFEGKYYTQKECKEVDEYAKKHGITIIPEIDMPGHSDAFERAMGFSMQTDNGVAVLTTVLSEIAEVFPDAPYIHIGADEETITYDNFLGIMTDHIHSLGKRVVVWNPIHGVNISNTDTDMTQMWSSSGNKIAGRPNIDCRYNYTNHFDIFADVVGIYRSNIYYVEKGNSEVAGTISAYWNDRKTPTEEDIVKQNNMYANVIASAERAWIGGGKQYIETGGTMLPNSGEEFDEFVDWERRFLFHKANSLKDEPIPYVKQTNVRWRITDAFPNGGDASAVFPPEEAGKSTSTAIMDESFDYDGATYYTGMATGAGIYLRHTWGNNIIPTYFGSTNYSNVTAYAWTYVYSPIEQTVGAQIEFQNYGRSEKDKAPDNGNWDRKGSNIWINGTRIAPPTWTNAGKNINNEVDLGNENFTARTPIAVTLKQGWNKVFIKLPYVSANGVRLNKWMFTCVFTDTNGKNAVDGLIYSPNQCKDDATERVAAKISEIKRDKGAYIGTAVGMWPESAATTIDEKIAEIEATYSTTMSEEQRDTQITELTTAWTTFVASLNSNNMNQPIASTDEKETYYQMCTPLRNNRYPTSYGAAADIVGESTATNASTWKFVKRTDGSFDIVNAIDNTYISPASNNNTALKTVAAQPSAGWTIKAADTKGYVIITSGNAQFNQTNNSTLGWKVYNWGSGTNTSDTGCQYKIIDVTATFTPDDVVGTATSNATNIDIYGLQKYYGLVQNAGTGIAGDGQIICNYPANTSQESNNAYANLIDGDYTTFFHSGYNETIGEGSHYLQANLSKSVKSFRFYLKKRHNNNNNRPTKITIQGSNDGNTWNEIAVVSNGFPTDAAVVDYYSAEITSETAYSKLRFTVNSTNTGSVFFSMSEFYILPNNKRVSETFDAIRNWRATTTKTKELAQQVNSAYDFNTALTFGIPANGGEYMLYSDTYSGGEFVNRYFYNNNGTLAMNTTADESNDAYIWTATEVASGRFTFTNKAGKYLSHKALSDAAYNFNVSSTNKSHMGVTLYSIDAQRYFVVKNDGTSFDQSTSTYNQKNGNWCTDFVFVPTGIYTGKRLTIVSNVSTANGTYNWNNAEFTSSIMLEEGETISNAALSLVSCHNAYKFEGFYQDDAYTLPVTSVTELTADKTIYAKFSLDIFSASLNEKDLIPVQIYNYRSNSYDIRMNIADNYSDKAVNSGTSIYGENEIWYLVGNEESFKMYSRIAGNSLAVKLAGTSRGSAATLATTGTDLCLVKQDNGSYGICPTTAKGQSLNMHGGNGYDIKLYDTSDGGSTWLFNKINNNPLELTYTTSLEGGYENNTRIGNISININGTTSNINLTKDNLPEEQICYLPVGATFSASVGTLYHGWTITFNGKESIPEQVIPAEGLSATANIAVDTDNKYQYLYYSNDAKGKPYRIPAIATAPNGTIFAISDNRPCGSDIGYGEVDIKCRISNDNGESWGEEFFVADGDGGSANVMKTGYGDAAIVADREQNKLLVMMVCGRTVCWNGRWHPDSTATSPNINRVARVYATYNETSGEWEWTEPVEVTNSIYELFLNNGTPTVSSMFIGSGRICQSRTIKIGDYYRLYCSIWTRDNGNRVIYSDDFGGSWHILGTVNDRPASGGDEPKCEELPDGSVLLSSRKGGGRYFNVFTYSDIEKGTGSWGTVVSSNNVTNGLSFGGNSTNGEVFIFKAKEKNSGDIKHIILQSVPTGSGRSDVSIYYKVLENETKYTPTTISQNWTLAKHVSTRGSAYSTITLQKDGRIGFFYEEEPNGYCMVYVPFTIEELTNDRYSLYEETPTGIEIIETDNVFFKNAVYDLSGRKIKAITKSGLYIVDGKKMFIEK